MGRFINPFTDYGFKFLFGREVEKELLIDFLNDLLVGEHVITDIQFLNNEQQPEVKTERGLIYDIYCVTDTGERIIVEMQNREQPYFKDRALFYLSRAITQQAKRGVWNFQLDAVYGVFFMNFVMDKDMPSKIRTDIVLSDRDTGKLFNNKFRQIFIELPNFDKEEDEWIEVGDSFEEFRASLDPMRYIDHAGEVAEYMLVLSLNELGESFLKIDQYVSQPRPYAGTRPNEEGN